jgi:hypothetical protein
MQLLLWTFKKLLPNSIPQTTWLFLKQTIHVNFKTSFLKSGEAHMWLVFMKCVNFFWFCAQNEWTLLTFTFCNNLCIKHPNWNCGHFSLLIDLKKEFVHKTQSVAIKSIRACEALVPGNLPSLLHTFMSAIIGFFMRGKTTSWVGPLHLPSICMRRRNKLSPIYYNHSNLYKGHKV